MGFEVFQKSSAPLAKVPSVTIQRRGLLSINRSAWAELGEPEAVELLFDRESQVIGLRPVDVKSPNAYPVRPQVAGSDKGPLLVAGQLFTQYYRIDTTQARRYIDPKVVDGIMHIDLKTGGQLVSSNRSRAPRSSDEGGDGAV